MAVNCQMMTLNASIPFVSQRKRVLKTRILENISIKI